MGGPVAGQQETFQEPRPEDELSRSHADALARGHSAGPEQEPSEAPDPYMARPSAFDELDDRLPRMPSWFGDPPFMAGTTPVLLLGLAFFAVGAFLHRIWGTMEGASSGLLQTASWFAWVGQGFTGLALLAAALRPSPATPGVRMAMLALGVFVVLSLMAPGGPLGILGLP